jgi:hypothetical protein
VRRAGPHAREKDIGGVDAPLEPPVEAEPDHPPQPLSVAGEQPDQRPLVPLLEAAAPVVLVARVVV